MILITIPSRVHITDQPESHLIPQKILNINHIRVTQTMPMVYVTLMWFPMYTNISKMIHITDHI